MALLIMCLVCLISVFNAQPASAAVAVQATTVEQGTNSQVATNAAPATTVLQATTVAQILNSQMTTIAQTTMTPSVTISVDDRCDSSAELACMQVLSGNTSDTAALSAACSALNRADLCGNISQGLCNPILQAVFLIPSIGKACGINTAWSGACGVEIGQCFGALWDTGIFGFSSIETACSYVQPTGPCGNLTNGHCATDKLYTNFHKLVGVKLDWLFYLCQEPVKTDFQLSQNCFYNATVKIEACKSALPTPNSDHADGPTCNFVTLSSACMLIVTTDMCGSRAAEIWVTFDIIYWKYHNCSMDIPTIMNYTAQVPFFSSPTTVGQGLNSQLTTIASATSSSAAILSVYIISVRFTSVDFVVDLLDETSQKYQSTVIIFKPLLEDGYRRAFGSKFRRIRKLTFRAGSVIVDSDTETDTDTVTTQSISSLKAGLQAAFANSGVVMDPNSITVNNTDTSSQSQTTVWNNFFIVVTVVGVVVVVAVVAIFITTRSALRSVAVAKSDAVRKPTSQA